MNVLNSLGPFHGPYMCLVKSCRECVWIMYNMKESDDEKCMFSNNKQIKTCLAQNPQNPHK